MKHGVSCLIYYVKIRNLLLGSVILCRGSRSQSVVVCSLTLALHADVPRALKCPPSPRGEGTREFNESLHGGLVFFFAWTGSETLAYMYHLRVYWRQKRSSKLILLMVVVVYKEPDFFFFLSRFVCLKYSSALREQWCSNHFGPFSFSFSWYWTTPKVGGGDAGGDVLSQIVQLVLGLSIAHVPNPVEMGELRNEQEQLRARQHAAGDVHLRSKNSSRVIEGVRAGGHR